MRPWPPSAAHTLRGFEIAVLGGLALWLVGAALVCQIDYYDGYDTVCNTRSFLGTGEPYLANRAPLMGLVLVPAEYLRSALDLHPLDLRPHHVTMALLHAAYLLGVYTLLVQILGRGWPCFVAFLATVPNFLFFTYAPFLTHDLVPGAVFLWMLLLAESFTLEPTWRRWLLLAVLGAAAALLKHMYAVFWIVVLVVQLSHLAVTEHGEDRRRGAKRWLLLAGAAALSGAVTWIALAVSLGPAAPQTPFLARPLRQVAFLLSEAPGAVQFPLWIYLRNAPAFGILTACLVIPATLLALRRGRTERGMAIAWILACTIMHVLPQRQVRYLAFLVPLSAYLVVPVVGVLLQRRITTALVLVVLAASVAPVQPYALLTEAARVLQPWYRDSPIRRFLEPLGREEPRRKPVIVNWTTLSFVPERSSPLAADPYHRVFHFGRHHLRVLLGYEAEDVVVLGSRDPEDLLGWPREAAMIVTEGPPYLNRSTWFQTPSEASVPPTQRLLVAASLVVRPGQQPGTFTCPEGEPVVLRPVRFGSESHVVMEGAVLGEFLRESVCPRLDLPGEASPLRLRRIAPAQFVVEGLGSVLDSPATGPLTVRAFALRRCVRR
ncbi:hypothetical protein ACFL59_06255 [Planctomycetota bacterium]